MKFYRLQKASEYDFIKFLEDKINLTAYQKEKLRDNEILRFSKYEIYTAAKAESKFIWRLTILFVIPYILLMYLFLPIKFIFTGTWGYGGKFIENFHKPWFRKLNLD